MTNVREAHLDVDSDPSTAGAKDGGREARKFTSKVKELLDRNCRFQPTLPSFSFCLLVITRWRRMMTMRGV